MGMRGSFGGGRGMGGGNMLRAVGRAVRTGGVAGAAGGGIPETFSTSTATTPTSPRSASNGNTNPRSSHHHNLSISSVSGPSSPCNKKPLSGAGAAVWASFPCDDYEIVSSWDGNWSEDENGVRNYYLDESVLGPVPSVDEVHNAVSALQQALDCNANPPLVRDRFGPAVDKEISGPDWIEPPVHFSNSRALQAYGCDRVYDAFHTLNTDPTVQRMVVSLSSDKAVWEAVLNNEIVKQLREAFNADAVETESIPSEVSQEDESSSDSTTVVDVIKRLFDDTRERFMMAIEKLTKLVTELFQAPLDGKEESTTSLNDSFEEKLRRSFMLSVVVLLIVVVTRAHSNRA